jgi:hypothetical protein
MPQGKILRDQSRRQDFLQVRSISVSASFDEGKLAIAARTRKSLLLKTAACGIYSEILEHNFSRDQKGVCCEA